jgi:hypothetical protein
MKMAIYCAVVAAIFAPLTGCSKGGSNKNEEFWCSFYGNCSKEPGAMESMYGDNGACHFYGNCPE